MENFIFCAVKTLNPGNILIQIAFFVLLTLLNTCCRINSDFGALPRSVFWFGFVFDLALFVYVGAKYADRHNLGTPIGWPTITSQRKIPTSQEVSDAVFTMLQHDLHNKAKISSFHMTFGQVLDHDLSLSNNPGGCSNPK